MWEFYVTIIATGEERVLFGTGFNTACEKYGYDPNELTLDMQIYID